MPETTSSGRRFRARSIALPALVLASLAAEGCSRPHNTGKVTVETLLAEMVDLEELSREPRPHYKAGASTSTDPASRQGGDAWFSNEDYDHFVRTETGRGRTEHVLANLKGPGTVTRIWTASPTFADRLRFYFDGQKEPAIDCSMAELFSGRVRPIGPAFAYEIAGAGDVYFPLPYARSLEITQEQDESREDEIFYYQVGYRTYEPGTAVETYDPGKAASWAPALADAAQGMAHPQSGAPWLTDWITEELAIPPGETRAVEVSGEKVVYELSARVRGTSETGPWEDPRRAHNAYRMLLLDIEFDGEESVRVPLGDFFGSGPGVTPYENLFFEVESNGRMTSRLHMPFRRSMKLRLTNAGRVPYEVGLRLRVGRHAFAERDMHLRAEWGELEHDTWPPFDMTFLAKTGAGKVVASTYEIDNPVLVWWGEGDQKISVDGEPFPSLFGTGTEDDHGFAYSRGDLFGHAYHAQTRSDGPRNGGHVSMNRLYVLDAVPYRTQIRFDEEVLHWINCRPRFSHVVHWYARPGSPGPAEIDPSSLPPQDLGDPADMLSFEGEKLVHEQTGGRARKEQLDNCLGAEHLVWRDAQPGQRMMVHFPIEAPGRYLVRASLNFGEGNGRERFYVDGAAAGVTFDGYAPALRFELLTLGVFDLRAGDNTIEAEALEPNPSAKPGSALGLDYVVLTKQ